MAAEGVDWLFKPDFSALLDPAVWSAAYGQIFFSLSVGFAIMIAYSSYLPEKSDINNNAVMTVFINCGFSLLAGVMVFAVLGYMAGEQGVAITEVVSSGVGLAFVTLPAAIDLLPLPWLLGPMFFLALVVAGFSSHISIMEAIVSSAIDKMGWERRKAASIICGSGALLSLVFATNGGLLLLDLVDYYINNIALLGSCLAELLLIAWVFRRLPEIRKHTNSVSEFAVGKWWELAIAYLCVGLLMIIVGNNLFTAVSENYGGYVTGDQFLFGWGLLAAMLIGSAVIAGQRSFLSPQEA